VISRKTLDNSTGNESVNSAGELTLSVDAFDVKASTSNYLGIAARMKAAREALGLSQARFSELYGHKLRTYQKNEAGVSEPGVCLAESFVRAGINANWLLTGDGPMLLADLTEYPRARRPAAASQGQSQVIDMTKLDPGMVVRPAGYPETAPSDSEVTIIEQYRAAGQDGKRLVERICEAISAPSLGAWLRAGQALGEAATIFDKKR
jgi:DNA-binding transcriptional regulator YiaG